MLRDGSVSDEALVARTLMWATVHSPTDGDGMTAYGVWTARRLRQSIDLARSSGDDRALLEALELVVSTLGVTFDLEGAVVSALEGHDLAVRIGDEKALSRFEVWVAMARHLEGDLGAMAQCARSAYERGLRAGDDTAVVHAVLMLRGLPPDERGPVPLLELDELLRRADALRQPTLVLHVLAVTTTAALAVGDQPSALESLGRMLLIAEGLDRTWPMASVGPIMLALPVALARGALEDAVRIRESLADIEHLLPSITPSMAPAYLAAVAPLRECVPPDRYDALAAEVRGVTLSQANRRVQAIVREYLPRTTSTARRPRVASSVTGTTLDPAGARRPRAAGRGWDEQRDRRRPRAHGEDRHAPHGRHLPQARRAWARGGSGMGAAQRHGPLQQPSSVQVTDRRSTRCEETRKAEERR